MTRVTCRSTLSIVLLLVAVSGPFGQGQITTIGIAGFRDETGADAPAEIRQKVAGALQQRLNQVHKDTLLARALTADGDPTVEQLAGLARQDGVAFVVRGGILGMTAGSVQLYADVISVETGTVRTLRAEGESTDGDAALSAAIARLAASIHDLVVSAAPPAAEAGETASADEELWQLIAQAEGILGNPSAISTQTLDSLRRSLERLNESLKAKAAIVAKNGDSGSAEREIAVRTQELQAVLAAATNEAAIAQDAGTPYEEPSAEKKSILASIDQYLGGATSILQQFQGLRTEWDGARGGSTRGEEPPSSGMPYEEITGGVTEDGEPLEGVTVTDPDSGATTTTDSNGSYTLRAIPGRTSRLVLTRKGKQLAMSRVVVQRGRPSVADFELKPRVASRPGLKVMPSTVLVKGEGSRAGSTGTLTGVVRDDRGHPLARVLVSLRGIAAARTDSQGRYAFIGVRTGTHELTVYRPGLKPLTIRTRVAARQTSHSPVSLTSTDTKAIAAKPDRPVTSTKPIITAGDDRGATANETGKGIVRPPPAPGAVRGQVVDAKTGVPIRGASISISASGGTTTTDRGSFSLSGLKPGTYQVIVKRTGYADGRANLTIRAGEIATLNLRLTPRAPMQIGKTPGKSAK